MYFDHRLFASTVRMDQDVQGRQDDQGQKGRRSQSADYNDRQRPLYFGADARREDQRKQSQRRRQRRHQHRPQLR